MIAVIVIVVAPVLFYFIGNRLVPRYFSCSKTSNILLAAAGTSLLPIVLLIIGIVFTVYDEIRAHPLRKLFKSIREALDIDLESVLLFGILFVLCVFVAWIFYSSAKRVDEHLYHSELSLWDQMISGLALVFGFFGVFIYIIISDGLIKEGGLFDPDKD